MVAADPTERIMWLILIVLLGCYFVGTWLNRRHGKSIVRWLKPGLAVLGGKPVWKILGMLSAGAQVTIADPTRPFQHVQIQYALLTREIPLLWAIELLRGKRDTLVLRARLLSEPRAEFEIVPAEGPLRRRLDADTERSLSWRPAPAGLGIGTPVDLERSVASQIERFLKEYGAHVARLSLRQRQPNLVLFLRLGALEKGPAVELLKAARQLSVTSSAPRGDSRA